MLPTKFQGHRSIGSREEGVLTICGHGSRLVHATKTIWTNFYSTIPWRRHMKFGFYRLSGFQGKNKFENVESD